MPELDINASANEVVSLLDQNRPREAAARLEALRQDQAPVVQEALDRYVADRGSERLNALRQPNAVATADAASVTPMLVRLAGAKAAPRFPAEHETENLSQAQKYDIYGSMVVTRGNIAAQDALSTNDRIILGMRNESRSTVNNGRGEYDDRLVVLWKDSDGSRHASEFNHATTEPTAQYDAHAKNNPRSPGFGNVIAKAKTEGEDVNQDQVRDLGRLAEGTTELARTTHPYGKTNEFALRPTNEAVRQGQNQVERDSNGDGWFDSRDVNGVQDLNNTFKIHRGSSRNTDSAGCQTIGGGEYNKFVTTVRGTPGQASWQYVLTSTAPARQQEQQHTQQADAPVLNGARPNADDPRQPTHPDHALQQQISTQLRGLGGRYAEHADTYSLSLLYDAKANNLQHVDRIVLSNAVGTRPAGDTLFLVQGTPGDPSAQRIGVSTANPTNMTVEASLERLNQQERLPAAPTPPVLQEEHQIPAQNAPAIGGR